MTARSPTARPTPRAAPLAPVAETPLGPPAPALVLFGREGGKPRAAWFAATEAEAATAAASAMRLRALPLADAAGRTLAGQLARGRVLPEGRALVPFVQRDLFARLIALAGAETGLSVAAGGSVKAAPAADAPPTALPEEAAAPTADDAEVRPTASSEVADKPSAPRPGAHLFVGQPRPGERSEIGLGSVVLAHEGPDDGWWEAEVTGANGRTFSLRWVGYDPVSFPSILRTADELALLPPGEP